MRPTHWQHQDTHLRVASKVKENPAPSSAQAVNKQQFHAADAALTDTASIVSGGPSQTLAAPVFPHTPAILLAHKVGHHYHQCRVLRTRHEATSFGDIRAVGYKQRQATMMQDDQVYLWPVRVSINEQFVRKLPRGRSRETLTPPCQFYRIHHASGVAPLLTANAGTTPTY